eukprot:jgi/Mesvir1/18317/Mv18470-RA.1
MSSESLGQFDRLTPDVRRIIYEQVVQTNRGDAAMLGLASKSMLMDIWPTLKQQMFPAPPALFDLVHDDWKPKYDSKGKTAVRFVVHDKRHKDFGGQFPATDRGFSESGVPVKVATVVIDWKSVVPFLKWRPGIDILIFDSACVEKPGFGIYYMEHAVFLALAHMRRWLGSYPCEMLFAFPAHKNESFQCNRFRLRNGDAFYQSFTNLMTSNNGVLFPDGAKLVRIGEGVDAFRLFQEIDPTISMRLFGELPAGMHAEGRSVLPVSVRVSNCPSLVFASNDDPEREVSTRELRNPKTVFLMGDGPFEIDERCEVHTLLKPGSDKGKEIAIRTPGVVRVCQWGTEDIMFLSNGLSLTNRTFTRQVGEDEKAAVMRRVPVLFSGM